MKTNIILELLTLSTKSEGKLSRLTIGIHKSGLEIVLRLQVN
jgi:hypothetical protein